MKKIIALMFMFLFCSCAHRPYEPGGTNVPDFSRQVVKVQAFITGKMYEEGEDGKMVSSTGKISWSGSGVVVGVDGRSKGESLIMTARHVVHVEEDMIVMGENVPALFHPYDVRFIVQRLDGSTCEAAPLHESERYDLGSMVTDCIAGDVAHLASSYPEVGDEVVVLGAPLGFHPRDVFLPNSGVYAGFDDGFFPDMIFSIPAVGGYSGSPIFHNGKVVSILVAGAIRYEHLTLGVSLDGLWDEFSKGSEAWRDFHGG